MKNRHKKMEKSNAGRNFGHSIWRLSGSVIIPWFWLTACQPAVVPLEKTVGLTRSDVKVVPINNGQNEKNSDQTKTTKEIQIPKKFGLPQSIILIDEPNGTQNPYQDQPIQDTVQQIDQKLVEQKTAAEIEAVTAVMNSITWQFQAGEKETKTLGENREWVNLTV